ncbi:hypothetical protein HOT49_gp283 [Erwinia phage vB_EamM_Alexandra]|uniref:Uncharacterized protein n=1 Tax=Erwinia phage vB_EamM_Alexandra TaxID=2201424 RepID=A0A2Z4QE44_9CAUD|nr:hypothetical protein HOT49_gp283 [Erwinia phage vB_EamM_Alexandra]AWY08542.1 hypothetical protein Alexandra_286 [Erwinia phage vB_EamM_Alexandra]
MGIIGALLIIICAVRSVKSNKHERPMYQFMLFVLIMFSVVYVIVLVEAINAA